MRALRNLVKKTYTKTIDRGGEARAGNQLKGAGRQMRNKPVYSSATKWSFTTTLALCISAMAVVLAAYCPAFAYATSAASASDILKAAAAEAAGTESSGVILHGDELDGATVRIRPAGSYSALAVNEDGEGNQNVVHMFHIGGSSRFYLEKVKDKEYSYHIYFYDSFTSKSPRHDSEDISSVLDVDEPYDKDGSVIHVVVDNDQTNKNWHFIRMPDGTYRITNERTGYFWALQDSDINADNNKLVQSSTPLNWEIEILPQIAAESYQKTLDSYNFDYEGETVTSSDWMTKLPDTAYVSDLTIPGAHDATTCNISASPFAGAYRCQQFYMPDLLELGVRYFDLRIYKDGSALALRHGNNALGSSCKDQDGNTITMDQVMRWTESFLDEHPGETVIFQIKDESDKDASTEEIYSFFESLAKQINGRIYSGDGAPQLADVRGKIIIMSRLSTSVEKVKTGDYLVDENDAGKGKWAISAEWQQGDAKDQTANQAASTDVYEVWTQDAYDMNADDKWPWIEYALFGRDHHFGAKMRHDDIASNGKKAWVVNYTSCVHLLKDTPQDTARVTNRRLLQSDELSTSANKYLGVVCEDFIDEQLAQRLYAINFKYVKDPREHQAVTFANDKVEKTYGDEPFSVSATSSGDGEISYASSNRDVATVNPGTGKVTIYGAGTTTITAKAQMTSTYLSGTATCELTVNKAPIAVKADDKTSVLGEALEELTHSIVGGSLMYADTIDMLGISASTTAASASSAGSHPIILSIDNASLNYDVTLGHGTYTLEAPTDGSSDGAKKTSIASAKAIGTTKTWTGKKITVTPKLKLGGKMLRAGVDYVKKSYTTAKPGSKVLSITGKGSYRGTVKVVCKVVCKQAKLSKAKPGKRKLVLSWAKTGATKYKVYYRVKGAKKWKSKTTKATKLTLAKLKAGKRYQVRVNSYAKGAGTTKGKVKLTKKVKR